MTLAIVPNINSSWYDPGRISGDPLITQDVNYPGGASTAKSTSKTTVRLMQDMSKRMLPTTIRQGLGVSEADPLMVVAAGSAIINGRWVLNTSTVDVDVSVIADDEYYLIFELTEIAESETRDPQAESITLIAKSTAAYTVLPNELVLAKFTVADSGTTITLIESYTSTPNQWAVGAIVPGVSEDGSVYGSVEIYSGAAARNLEAVAEPDGFRIAEKLIIDDTDVTPVAKVHLRNWNQILEARNAPADDNDYVPFAARSLKIGTELDSVEIINVDHELVDVALINTKTIPAGSSELLDRDTAPSSPVLNKELQDSTVLFVDNNDPTKKMAFELVNIPTSTIVEIIVPNDDIELIGKDSPVITTPYIGSLINMPHNHSNEAGGTQFNLNNAADATDLDVPHGGTGVSTLTDDGPLYGQGAGVIQAQSRLTAGQILIGAPAGLPAHKILSGDAEMDNDGVVTVLNHYNETQMDAFLNKEITNKGRSNIAMRPNLISFEWKDDSAAINLETGSAVYLYADIPVETIKGSQKLTLAVIYIGMLLASPNNKLTAIDLVEYRDDASIVITPISTEDKTTAPTLAIIDITDKTVHADTVAVALRLVGDCTDPAGLAFSWVGMDYYYT